MAPVSIIFETRERLSSSEFCVDGIVKIIRSYNKIKLMVMMKFQYV